MCLCVCFHERKINGKKGMCSVFRTKPPTGVIADSQNRTTATDCGSL